MHQIARRALTIELELRVLKVNEARQRWHRETIEKARGAVRNRRTMAICGLSRGGLTLL